MYKTMSVKIYLINILWNYRQDIHLQGIMDLVLKLGEGLLIVAGVILFRSIY